MEHSLPSSPTGQDLATCQRVLDTLAADPALLVGLPPDTRRALLEAAGRLARPTPADRRRRAKAFRRRDRELQKAADDRVLEATRIRELRRVAVFPTPPALPPPPRTNHAPGELIEPRKCYVCKVEYRRVHFFYDAMCPPCAELNYHKRFQSADLGGRVALVTGARVKIGYQTAIKLLHAGARVIVTTRFPADAERRYRAEAGYPAFCDRLHIHGLDLRYTPAVERFAAEMTARFERLDFIINNACQTVRRPPGFYAHLLEAEPGAVAAQRDLALFPAGSLDADQQQIDLRPVNSWRLTLAEVPAVELLEVHLVNAVAPFVLNARLKPLLLADRSRPRQIVNVSAMEGQFYRAFKTDRHPHTNMAKAALNMMTRTAAPDYAKDGIYMNSVDTGWVTDEDPAALAARKVEEHGFSPPLDIVDGAARVLDPVFTGSSQHGRFYKDYRPTEW
jgi:NAD(P)-dependent dehydrogenase (short-subunit alcohol dehydrogenase family)